MAPLELTSCLHREYREPSEGIRAANRPPLWLRGAGVEKMKMQNASTVFAMTNHGPNGLIEA